jgi:alkylation response protein AidB-like acyl-CoA dehydrogenase
MTVISFNDARATRFREEVRLWLDENVPDRWRDERERLSPEQTREFQQHWDKLLYDGGYAGLTWPTEYGGRGMGPVEELIYYQESARANAPEGFGRIGRVLAGPTIITCGSGRQQSTYLPRILDGSEIWCQGFSEPGAGSDLAAVKTTAKPVEGGYLVSGQKIWTSFAQYSRRCLMLARTSDGPRHHNLTFLLLDMEQPGIDVRPIKQISGDEEFSEVFFTDAFVAEEDRVGGEGEGWQVAMTVLTNERGTTEAGTRLVEITAQVDTLTSCCATRPDHLVHAESLRQRNELLRWHVVRATEEKAAGEDWFRSGSTLKVIWSELLQACGRLGVETNCARHRSYWRHHYLDARAASIYSGTNEIQRNIITDRVLKVPRYSA